MARTSKTPAQQAALDQARADKAKAANPIAEELMDEDMEASFIKDALSKLPTGKRALIAMFAGFAAGASTTYVIQILVGYAIAGVLALSGSVLLSTLISLIGIIVSIMAAMLVGSKVFSLVITGQIDDKFAAVKNKVSGLFKRKEITVAA